MEICSLINKKGQDVRLSKEEFLDPVKRAQANSELSKNNKLSFEMDDIKFLIINDESEIGSMINSLRKIFRGIKQDRIEVLCSKIITSKEIFEDF